MYSNTQNRIFEFLKKSGGARVKEIINYLGFQPAGVFKHLKKMQESGLIYKVGKPPEVRYHIPINAMGEQSTTVVKMLNWAASGGSQFAASATLSLTRDVFQARTDHLVNELKHIVNDNVAYLLTAVAGEIGNNSFDHNLGRWKDISGVYFCIDEKKREIVLADRGQGIFATIKRVKSTVSNEQEAVRVAFTEVISGRAPEKRGNGLKFVKKVIEENQLYLELYTGSTKARISSRAFEIVPSGVIIPGTAAYIKF